MATKPLNRERRAEFCERYAELIALSSTRHPDFDLALGELLVAFAAAVEGSDRKAQYTKEDRARVVFEYLNRGDTPRSEILQRHDISSSTLYSWVQQAGRA